ncbi:MAG: hypothetical protein KDA53_10325 [Hyphomonas sp.]|nr:hypothetical protein [Hyphomonas sp.]
MWLVLLIAIAFGIGTVLFGTIAYNRALHRPAPYAGWIGSTVESMVRFPGLVTRILSGNIDEHTANVLSHDLPAGFTYAADVPEPNYVLISRYDGDIRRSVVELADEADGKVLLRRVMEDPKRFAFPVTASKLQVLPSADPSTMRSVHPLLTSDGGMLVHFESAALYKLDACGGMEWKNSEFVFHHSLNLDHEGNIWMPGTGLSPETANAFDPYYTTRDDFHDDYIVQLDPAGNILFSKSILEILSENGLDNRFYDFDQYQYDPIHLNDIQPVMSDGPYWQKGDVFVSLGHLNMLMLYRPSENRLLWWTQDQVMHQHDIDVLDDHRIIVFNNRRRNAAAGTFVSGHNEVLMYDFTTDKMTPVSNALMAELGVATMNQGLQDIAPDGGLMVEETNSGRLVRTTADGKLMWQYANRAADGTAFTLNWSRYIPRAEGDQILQSANSAACTAE